MDNNIERPEWAEEASYQAAKRGGGSFFTPGSVRRHPPCSECGVAEGFHHMGRCSYAGVYQYLPSAPADPAEAADKLKAYLVDEARKITSGARRLAYGTPENNFARIAAFWQAYMVNTGRADANITAADVSPMMRLMKEARLCATPDHLDSFVDMIGYTLTGAEINGVQPDGK